MSEQLDMILAAATFEAAHRANYSFRWVLAYGLLCELGIANAIFLSLRKRIWA